MLPRYNFPAFIAWSAGFVVGALSVNNIITITTVSAFDSMLSAALCYCMLAAWRSQLNFSRN